MTPPQDFADCDEWQWIARRVGLGWRFAICLSVESGTDNRWAVWPGAAHRGAGGALAPPLSAGLRGGMALGGGVSKIYHQTVQRKIERVKSLHTNIHLLCVSSVFAQTPKWSPRRYTHLCSKASARTTLNKIWRESYIPQTKQRNTQSLSSPSPNFKTAKLYRCEDSLCRESY